MRRSIATVCLSGTLEDKLSAAAARGVRRRRDLRERPARVPAEPRAGRRTLRRPRAGRRPLPAVPRLRGRPRGAAPAQPPPGRAQVRADAAARRGHRPGVLVRSRPTPSTTTRWPPRSCAPSPTSPPSTACASPTRRWRGGRHVRTYERSAELVLRADHPALGLCLDSFHVLSVGGDDLRRRRLPRREALLPPARRRPAHAHGRAPVEPPPPPVPRAGRVRPRRFPSRRARRRVRRPAVAGGLQRRVPAGDRRTARPSTRCAP